MVSPRKLTLSKVCIDQGPIDGRERGSACLGHRHYQLSLQNLVNPLHARSAVSSQPPAGSAAYAYGFCAQREGFQYVRS